MLIYKFPFAVYSKIIKKRTKGHEKQINSNWIFEKFQNGFRIIHYLNHDSNDEGFISTKYTLFFPG